MRSNNSHRITFFFVGVLATAQLYSPDAFSQNQEQSAPAARTPTSESGFWSANFARDMFDQHEQDLTQQPSIEEGPRPKFHVEAPPAETVPPEGTAAKQTDPKVAEQSEALRKLTEEEIVKKYGDPKKDSPIKPIKDAPLPFAGLTDALNSGNEKLAYEYARQYVRHIENLKTRTEQITSLVGVAKVREGYSESNSIDKNTALPEHRALLEDDLDSARKERGLLEQSGVVAIDPRVQSLIEKAKQEDAQKQGIKQAILAQPDEDMVGQASTSMEFRLNENEVRQFAQKKFSNRLPVDSQGDVKVYFFFRMHEASSVQFAQQVDDFYSRIAGNKRVEMQSFAIDIGSRYQVDAFRQLSKSAFPILDGQALAGEMHIVRSPTAVFISKSSGKAYFEEGVHRAAFYEEMLKIMLGRQK